jgi:hypothetical protein
MHNTFDELVEEFHKTKFPPDWRSGQSAFNFVYEYLPTIANQIRNTQNDPFYESYRLNDFWIEVKRLYDEQHS